MLLNLTYSSTAYTFQTRGKSENNRLRWAKKVIPISLSTSLLNSFNIKSESDVSGAVLKSLQTWENYTDKKFKILWTDLQSVSPSGNFGDGVNLITIAQTPENLLLFNGEASETAARTRVFFNRQNSITEADIILNPYSQYSTDETVGSYDLQATITHELGHLLGLEHSWVIGSAMYEHQGKNGIYSLPNTAARQLAEDDIAGIKTLYNTSLSEEDCCGAIAGALSGRFSKNDKYYFWAEESLSGRIIAGVESLGGKFKIEGLKSGKYNVYSKNLSGNNSAAKVGEFEVEKGKTTNISDYTAVKHKNFDLKYIGFNGQISEVAVPVNAGRTYVIYVGGKNLEPEKLKVEFSSRYLSFVPGSIVKQDYGSEISAFSFEVKIDENAEPGEYSLSLTSRNGASDTMLGAIIIRDTINPWYKYIF